MKTTADLHGDGRARPSRSSDGGGALQGCARRRADDETSARRHDPPIAIAEGGQQRPDGAQRVEGGATGAVAEVHVGVPPRALDAHLAEAFPVEGGVTDVDDDHVRREGMTERRALAFRHARDGLGEEAAAELVARAFDGGMIEPAAAVLYGVAGVLRDTAAEVAGHVVPYRSVDGEAAALLALGLVEREQRRLGPAAAVELFAGLVAFLDAVGREVGGVAAALGCLASLSALGALPAVAAAGPAAPGRIGGVDGLVAAGAEAGGHYREHGKRRPRTPENVSSRHWCSPTPG